MKNAAEKKMDSLMKYVPFIDFVLKIDPLKYVKFSNIRKWIILKKKKYPLSDLNKIEQSIVTQYKNLLLEKKVQIPQNITSIFAPLVFNQYVNLCSDEEDEVQNEKGNSMQNAPQPMKEKSGHANTNPKYSEKVDDSDDDDLEFISIDYVGKTKSKIEKEPLNKPPSITKDAAEGQDVIDEISQDILCKIDKLTADDLKMKSKVHEPINYTYKEENEYSDSTDGEGVIYQRRINDSDVLFKRRTDFIDEVVVQNLVNPSELQLPTYTSTEIISLDSCSDSECRNEDERPSTSKEAASNETRTEEKEEITSDKNQQIIENTDSSSNSSNSLNKKVELLCNSIDSILPNISDLLEEPQDTNDDSTTNLYDKQISERLDLGSDKENNVNSISENNIDNKNTRNLTPEEISKLLEDISSKTDIEWEIFNEALLHVFKMNSNQKAATETPPPAPPVVDTNLPTPNVQPCFVPQQQAQLDSSLPSQYPPNTNFLPMAVKGPPKPKINLNDPRIKKQLQVIQNSPLFTYNMLNAEIEDSIRKMCLPQSRQPPQAQQQTSFSDSAILHRNNMVRFSKTSTNLHKSSISYGEYKRRQLEKKLEMERQREEARKAKAKEEMEREREKLELSKNKQVDVRTQLLTTLSPCKEQLTSLWSKQTNSNTKADDQEENSNQMTATSSENMNILGQNKRKKMKKKNKHKNKNADNSTQNKNIKDARKRCRVYNELKCTFKGFDQIQDYIAEEALDKSSENGHQSATNSDNITQLGVTTKPTALRRRCSIHALSAISEQLGQMSSDCSDSEYNSAHNTKRRVRNSSTESLSQDAIYSTPKRRKTIDEIPRPTLRAKALRIVDDDTPSAESLSDEKRTNAIIKQNGIIKEAVIKLHRISQEFIRKHTKMLEEDTSSQNFVNEQSITLKKTGEIVKPLKETAQKMPKLKKYNNDCQMTERSTSFCALCRCKPSDLTNHYIGRHKTESYVSRLDWSELEDLTTNTLFAKLQTKSNINRFERYEVECPFCKEIISDQFINLYNHYSAHTGEYAFQCSHCHLSKPYKPDIQSHVLHSKVCRNSSIQVMYRYPPQAQCIYLHYCTICNFVQLNEANVLKHLREHHDCSKAIASNVQKCILAAMSDGPDVNQTCKSPSPTTTPILETLQENSAAGEANQLTDLKMPTNEIDFKVDDDDIPVSNEPCLDDEDMKEERTYSLEEQLKQMHEELSQITNSEMKMTVIHSIENSVSRNTGSEMTNIDSMMPKKHEPIKIKLEAMDVEENIGNSSKDKTREGTVKEVDQQVLGSFSVYEKYRDYPLNVSYLGLYKCMIDDCYYSTDCSQEIVKHLNEHSVNELKPNEYLQCPYCVIKLDIPITPIQLVEHVRTQHGHMNFQCSICCYRSSNASNVYVHQKLHHNSDLNSCRIYKCASEVLKANDRKQNLDLDKRIAENVFKIACKICNAGFYFTQFLIKHLYVDHKVVNVNDLKIYSCLYCPFMGENKNQIRTHVATKHPGEQPLIYDHNTQINFTNGDTRSSLNVVNLSESVTWTEATPTTVSTETNEGGIVQDIKPEFIELLRINEETAKIRLHKLTAHTGVPPDCLYRCPDPMCGFFSNFELWLRHMKVRHHTFECVCPHCSIEMMLPLDQFRLHFEQHRRHTFICFYCSITSPTELLAREHATLYHADFEPMRIEKIRCNISYSYTIMIQTDLFKERQRFIAEFLPVLENRLKELENIEIEKLKHQWPVRDDTPWIYDYLQIFSKRKVALRCLVPDCSYRTYSEKPLYNHLKTSHTISGTQFNCSKCDYQVDKCNNFDEIFNHIKLHNEYIFICVACSFITLNRPKMSSHIREQHSARDVPVIHLFRTSEQMYIKIYIAFSDNHLSFSTMKNCFCCTEQNMSGDVYSLHLKHYHKLSLHYYCEICTNFSFQSLKEVKPHFKQLHNSDKFKISCELAAHNDLNVVSLNDFRIQISSSDAASQHVKKEPLEALDSDVILIEDNDIEIKNSIREEQAKRVQIPLLKCTSLSKLIEPSISNLPVSSISVPPPLIHSHFSPINSYLQQFTPASSVPSSNVTAQTSYNHYNLNPAAMNSSVNIANRLSSVTASSVISNPTHMAYNDAVIPSNLSSNNIPTQIVSSVNIANPMNSVSASSAISNPTNMAYNDAVIPSNLSSNNIPTQIGSSVNIANPLSSVAAPSAILNATHMAYNDAVIPSTLPSNNIPTQIRSFPSHAQNQVNLNMYNLHVSNNFIYGPN